jgi:Na+/H+-dicarboxylate symporter
MYNASLPDLYTYSIFAITFAFAQFGGISIPGGGSIIIMPLLFSHLNFNAEMTSLVIILTLIMDPVSTANNVLGNSSFVIITRQIFVFITSTNKEKLFNYFQRNERL